MLQTTITSFSPTSGVAGNSVVILGSNFSQVSRVEFGGTAATFTINSDSQITATVPSSLQSGAITVTAPGIIATSNDYFRVGLSGSSIGSSGGNAATLTAQGEQITILQQVRDRFGAQTDLEATDDVGSSTFFSFFKRLLNTKLKLSAAGNLKTALAESVPGGENHLGEVGGRTVLIEATLIRPADTVAYTANDAIADSTSVPTAITFPNISRIGSGSGLILTFKLTKSTITANTAFRLWLYSSNPVVIPADNTTFQINNANRSSRIGYVDFVSPIVGIDCVEYFGVPVFNQIAFKLTSGSSLYGILQVLGAYTPGSGEQFYFQIGVIQD